VGLADLTFASLQATEGSRDLLRKVFALRAERIVQLHAGGRLGWIRATGARVRLVESVEANLLPRRAQWDDIQNDLVPEIAELFVDWAWTHIDMQDSACRAFRVPADADHAGMQFTLLLMVKAWLRGSTFKTMSEECVMSMNDLLGVHSSVITFALQTLVEQGTSLLGQCIESRGGVLSSVVVDFPSYLRYGVSTPTGRTLAARGVRHRRAYVLLGEYVHSNSIATSSTSDLHKTLLHSLEVHQETWETLLGRLVYLNTVTDLQ